MEGIYYAGFIIAILLVIRWAMVDDLGGGEGKTGVFAMTARRAKHSSNRRTRSRFRRSEETE